MNGGCLYGGHESVNKGACQTSYVLCIASDQYWPDQVFQQTSPLIALWFVGFLRLAINMVVNIVMRVYRQFMSGNWNDSVSNLNFSQQDYGKESQAKDVIEEYFKSKK